MNRGLLKLSVAVAALAGVIVGMSALEFSAGCKSVEKATGKKWKTVNYMRVEFFKFGGKEEKFVGTVVWRKDANLSIDVTDPELEAALKSPFVTTKGEQEGDRHVLYAITLQPKTLEHLVAMALELPGYIGIIHYEEKP